MSSRSIIPAPLRQQPWHVLLPLAALNTFGSAVLYSAAGGRMWPWAGMHMLHFAVFLALAMAVSRVPRHLFTQAAFPAYAALIVLLVLVEAVGRIGGGSQRWLNLGFM
ncbi:MAG TPA: FtsW/RodA/SpoVE family cell cycle protein, partial [Novosphingobium sp.]|nr:FtsW/RodA/SpoVE family cell cycle protein [Novosphingobium sp.]